MPVFRVRYRPSPEDAAAPPDCLVEADSVQVEADVWLVFRRTVFVIGAPRDVVVRRLPAAPVADVAEVL